MKPTISKIDFMKIVSCFEIFAKACEEKGVKFNKYSEEELRQILVWYKRWKIGDKPPF